MSAAAVKADQRFTASNPCPICGGHKTMPHGRGVRCFGFLSDDGRYAHCTREEFAGRLDLDSASTYAHILEGPCNCGATHGETRDRSPKPHRTIVRKMAHTLRDQDGKPLFNHMRTYYSDGEKRVWWEQMNGNTGLGGVELTDLPLYGVHELGWSDIAVVTEGETARDAVSSLGIAALGTVCGAKSKPGDGALQPILTLDTVYLWPDHDADGRNHMANIGRRLCELGHRDVRVIEWPEAPAKGDAADLVKSGGAVEDVRRLMADALPFNSHSGHESDQTAEPEQVGEVWPDLQPLPPATPVPTLPADLLPEPLRPWIADVADVNRIPVEMVAMPAIVALGSIVGRSVGLRPWNYNDHVVVPNLWGLVVTRPGWMKTSAVGEALKPIGRLAALERESYEERRDIAAAEIAALEAVLEDVKRRMREAAKKGETLDTLKEQFAEKTRELRELKVTERRYITHDATIEKLAELLIENPRGMLVARDEVYGLLRSFEKSGHENDRQFYLEGWSGTGSFTTDRIGRGTLHIPAVTLSIIGGIQPGRLRNMIDEAASGGGGDDGLLQRFQLTVWPDRLEPWQKPTRWPDGSARERAFTIFKAIDELRPLGLSPKSDGDVPYLTFTPFAQRIADDWRDELEHRLRSDEFDNAPAFASHLAKYRSLMPSLALLFHLVDIAGGTTKPGPINEGPTRLAAAWCEFLEVHARKLYDVEVDRGKRAAQALAAKIKAGNIVNEETVRDIYRNQWSGLKTDEIVTDGLAVLESLGWVRLESIATAGRARQIVRLHPDLRRDGSK